MNNREAVNWLINISADIGKAEHSDLWHYEQALTEIKDMLESAQPKERTEKRTETRACDLISRQAAVDGKISIQCANGVEIYSEEAVPVEYLKALPPAQPEQRWIPCSERLPEIPCLVSDANHNTPYVLTSVITLEDKEHGKWAIDGRWLERTMVDGKKADMLIYHNRIVAWMPLPEPYKEGGADG